MQLNITKVLSQLNEKSDKDQDFLEKFNRLFYGEQRANNVNWEDFYMLINLLYDGFAEKLQLTYANILNEKEIQLCCLLKANMETTEIAWRGQGSSRRLRAKAATTSGGSWVLARTHNRATASVTAAEEMVLILVTSRNG